MLDSYDFPRRTHSPGKHVEAQDVRWFELHDTFELAPHDGTPSKSSGTVLARETMRGRTFAIISHLDAGKTTLTEKLLLAPSFW